MPSRLAARTSGEYSGWICEVRTGSVYRGWAKPASVTSHSSRIRIGLRLAGTIDFGDLGIGEAKLHGADDAGHLTGGTHPDDGGGDRRASQGPCDGDFAGAAAVARADRFHQFGQREVARKLGLLEGRGAAAEIVFRQGSDALAGHLAGEQAALHRRVADDADLVLETVGENGVFDFGGDRRVRRLQRRNGRDGTRPLQLRGVEVAHPDPAHLAFVLESRQGLPAFFDISVGLGPMDLVKVDDVDLQAAQAILALLADGIALEHLLNLA